MVCVYLQGNCQCPAMARLLRGTFPSWDVRDLEVYKADLSAGPELVIKQLAAADIVVIQPIQPGYRGVDWLSTQFAQSRARPGQSVIVVPSINVTALYPETRYLGQLSHRLRVNEEEQHNVPLARMVMEGVSPTEAVARVLDPEFYSAGFVEARWEQAWKELRQREHAVGAQVGVSDIVQWDAGKRLLMHTVNHPTRSFLAQVTNRVLRILGERGRVSEEGPDPLDGHVLPMLPSTARHLGLSATVYSQEYRRGALRKPLASFLQDMANAYAALPRKVLGRYLDTVAHG